MSTWLLLLLLRRLLRRQPPVLGHLDGGILLALLLILLLLLLSSLQLQPLPFPPPLLLPPRHQLSLHLRLVDLGSRLLRTQSLPLHQGPLQVEPSLGQFLGPTALLSPFPISPALPGPAPLRLGIRQGRLRCAEGRDGVGRVRLSGGGGAGPLMGRGEVGDPPGRRPAVPVGI